MQPTSLRYAGYWRTSLADAKLGKGALGKRDIDSFTKASLGELEAGCLSEQLVTALFKDEPHNVELVDLLIRPRLYMCQLAHGQERGSHYPPVVSPLIGKATLRRNGKLYPAAQTMVPRDLLEPLERGTFSIGAIDEQDQFLTMQSAPLARPVPGDADNDSQAARHAEAERLQSWRAYLAYGERQLGALDAGWQREEHQYQYLCVDYWLLAKTSSAAGASVHILPLYDHMLANDPACPLFDRYASVTQTPLRPCLVPNAAVTERVGHASDMFPLADAQRDSLTHLLASAPGDMLAVNGPPGTGKTTLVLSVVASLWVTAALEGREPPLVLAASTNNQAVTNIIDAFGKDFATGSGPLAGRWLPEVASFGAYMPSRDKEKKAAGLYQTNGFFDNVENTEYVARAKAHYLDCAAAAFPHLASPALAIVVTHLHTQLQQAACQLADIAASWEALLYARQVLRAELGDDHVQALAAHENRLAGLAAASDLAAQACTGWQRYQAEESLWWSLFSWLPGVARRRLLRVQLFLTSLLGPEPGLQQCRGLQHLDAMLARRSAAAASALATQQEVVIKLRELVGAEQAALGQWQRNIAFLGAANSASMTLADCDRLLDTSLRFDMFRLATHYWEGRWLLDMQALGADLAAEKRKRGRATVQARWQRRMKLTPCAVSTFFMLPSLMKVSRAEGAGFVSDYLYNFIDLLIVDEAGQVLPEVAGASFALAKKALVIGDSQQIEPIWSVPHPVDVGNMLKHGLIASNAGEHAYELIADAGKAAACGSVMRIAQYASNYHYDTALERGMFLNEHRRCYDQIISFCNRLCYRGKLVPKRGARPVHAMLPALGYLHVHGVCEQKSGGSRQNTLEARTVAAWLHAHQDALERYYARPLHQIVGVVTPFGAQVRALRQACANAGLAAGDSDHAITIGTVHALQGAERALILFSPVYSKHADGAFIDRSLSMLNVAVSRAKDSFLVFGDMDVFDPRQRGTARGLLATYLFANPANALVWSAGWPEDAAPASTRPVGQLRYMTDASDVKYRV